MEIEKRKKKRATKEDEEDCERRMKQKLKSKASKKEEKEEESCSEVPTEEEVEEFYAILKRMKVVVKYFDDKGKGGREWRETLEKPAELAIDGGAENIAAVDRGGENIKKKENIGGEVVIIRQGFDLNAMAPEAAESGGA